MLRNSGKEQHNQDPEEFRKRTLRLLEALEARPLTAEKPTILLKRKKKTDEIEIDTNA